MSKPLKEKTKTVKISFGNKNEEDIAYHLFEKKKGLSTMVAKAFGIQFGQPRENVDDISEISVKGPAKSVWKTAAFFDKIKAAYEEGETLDDTTIKNTIDAVQHEAAQLEKQPPAQPPPRTQGYKKQANSNNAPAKPALKYVFKAATKAQTVMWNLLKEHKVVLAEGPAGTGKTHVPIAFAAEMLERGEIDGIVLARPAISTGRELGAFTGGPDEKLTPYLRPLFDELTKVFGGSVIGAKVLEKHMKDKVVEIAPVELIQGRTFENKFVIVDEASLTENTQMRTILTRIGKGSKMAVTGSFSQKAARHPNQPAYDGLDKAVKYLSKGVKSVGFVQFTTEDIMREAVVRDIVEAYERGEANEAFTPKLGNVVNMKRSR